MSESTQTRCEAETSAPADNNATHLNPPVIILGGEANALSIARGLARNGVKSYAINRTDASIRYSRFCQWIDLPNSNSKASWSDFLLGARSEYLRNAILFPASDDALQVVIEHHEELADKFQLSPINPEAQETMLNKLATYLAAKRAGVPTPKFWLVDSLHDVERIQDELVFPLLLKPLVSHTFTQKHGVKFIVADDYQTLLKIWEELGEQSCEMMLVEKIPGPDSQLCSYYTFVDMNGDHLFQFTKRIIRRFPPEMGIACAHRTDSIPELYKPAEDLFREVGILGLANVEFKLDPRDGVLKLIECNARFTAANTLLDRCGFDLANFAYQKIVHDKTLSFNAEHREMYLWSPVDDFRAFLVLWRRGEIGFFDWLSGVCRTNFVFPIFQWSDPLPAVVRMYQRVLRLITPKSK
ncbi:MAG: hypothetical protein NXI22_09830 [bacterium]|nr:hypothetical protein [bacterium]